MALRMFSLRRANMVRSSLFTNTGKMAFSADIMRLEMSALSPTMTEGKIAQWNIKEGEKVEIGDVICEIQTDKATVGYES